MSPIFAHFPALFFRLPSGAARALGTILVAAGLLFNPTLKVGHHKDANQINISQGIHIHFEQTTSQAQPGRAENVSTGDAWLLQNQRNGSYGVVREKEDKEEIDQLSAAFYQIPTNQHQRELDHIGLGFVNFEEFNVIDGLYGIYQDLLNFFSMDDFASNLGEDWQSTAG